MQEHVHAGNCALRLLAATMIKTVAAITSYLLDSVSTHSGIAQLRPKCPYCAVLLKRRSLALGEEVALRTRIEGLQELGMPPAWLVPPLVPD